MTAVLAACVFANGHDWHPDPTYIDAGLREYVPDGAISHPKTAQRCCLCDARNVVTHGVSWSGSWAWPA
ncbi:hypothetical protein LCGC14_0443730 [marine sediment metagenome]|uniref:Uncharacterized protein n=1 Tax=marine sediment metagenome TaxID=412755 RepID=A0A0F9T2X5_9ZZZZ